MFVSFFRINKIVLVDILCRFRYLLITKQWEEEARKALKRLRASNQVEEDIEEMRAEERAQQAESTISMTELICSPTLRAPLVIGIVMQLSQQLSGINAVRTVTHFVNAHPRDAIFQLSLTYTFSNVFFFFRFRYFTIPQVCSQVLDCRMRVQNSQP